MSVRAVPKVEDVLVTNLKLSLNLGDAMLR